MSTTPVTWETIDALIQDTADDGDLSLTWLEDLAEHQPEIVGYAFSEDIQTVYTENERFQVIYLLSIAWKALKDILASEVIAPETIEAIDEANWIVYESAGELTDLLDQWIDESKEPELLELFIQGILEEEDLEERTPEAIWGLFLLAKTCLDSLLTLRPE